MLLKLFFVLMVCLLASLTQSCAQIDVKKMTYMALRQHDCRVTEPSAFCARSFSIEYHQYEQMRQQFLADKQIRQYRVKLQVSQTDSGSFAK